MGIAWNLFTPGPALAGGVLIGVAASILILALGRIAGISGIIGRLLHADTWEVRSQWLWRVAFVLGLLLAPLLWMVFAPMPELDLPRNPLVVIAAGLLVGVGTRMGAGCTSGHGVCGISRLSLRSVVATLVFMATGIATVFVMRHVLEV